jgi:hypothetical protein
MVRSRSLAVVGVALALVVTACNGDDSGEDSTTTSTTLTVPTTTTTTLDPASTTTTTRDGEVPAPPEYEIVRRIPGEDGDTLVVLLDPSSYDGLLTDIDLQNVVADVVERFPPVLEAYVVDSQDAVDLVLLDERTPEEQAVLDEHAFVTLEEGFRIVFTGPFGDFGELILGS